MKHVSFCVDVVVGCRTGGVGVTAGLGHVQVLVGSTGELGLLVVVGLLVVRVSTGEAVKVCLKGVSFKSLKIY